MSCSNFEPLINNPFLWCFLVWVKSLTGCSSENQKRIDATVGCLQVALQSSTTSLRTQYVAYLDALSSKQSSMMCTVLCTCCEGAEQSSNRLLDEMPCFSSNNDFELMFPSPFAPWLSWFQVSSSTCQGTTIQSFFLLSIGFFSDVTNEVEYVDHLFYINPMAWLSSRKLSILSRVHQYKSEKV